MKNPNKYRATNLSATDPSDEEVIALALERDVELVSGVVLPLTHEELMKQLRA